MDLHHVPLSGPDISEEDIQAVVKVLKTPRLSLGPKLPEFEEKFASYIGTKHAVAVSSGTAALHLCVHALGLGEGDEVITTPFSFIASANCVLFERATVKFVDILPDTLCIDPAQVEAAITEKTKAIIAVDIFGYLCEWKALEAIATRHKLALIEDSCEALGSAKGDRKAGAFGDCGVFGFYPNKQMTTGEGGMVTTNRDDIAFAARSMRNQGRDPQSEFLDHRRLGYNYRISDINCALGITQLKRLPEFVSRRMEIVDWYEEELAGLSDHLSTPYRQEGAETSWFVYVVHLADRYSSSDRDLLIKYLREHGIGCNNYFPAIHLQPFYMQEFGYKNGNFPVTERVSEKTLALPFYTKISREKVAHVARILDDGINSIE